MSKVKDFECWKCKQLIEPYQEYYVYDDEKSRFVLVCHDCFDALSRKGKARGKEIVQEPRGVLM